MQTVKLLPHHTLIALVIISVQSCAAGSAIPPIENTAGAQKEFSRLHDTLDHNSPAVLPPG